MFNRGRIEQVGTPRDVYERPATEFVAGFVGTANLLRDGEALVSIRPEHIRFGPPTDGEIGADGIVGDVQYLGPTTRFRVTIDGGTALYVDVSNTESSPRAAVGDAVQLSWQRTDRQRVGSPT